MVASVTTRGLVERKAILASKIFVVCNNGSPFRNVGRNGMVALVQAAGATERTSAHAERLDARFLWRCFTDTEDVGPHRFAMKPLNGRTGAFRRRHGDAPKAARPATGTVLRHVHL